MTVQNKITIDEWKRVSKELLIDVEFNVYIETSDNKKIKCLVLVKNFGHTNGMLIFESYESIKGLGELLNNKGYGYSVMPFDPIDSFDLESFKCVLYDWGWSGTKGIMPEWYIDGDSAT